MGDLAACMHASVGASSDDESRRTRVAENSGEGSLEGALHRTEPRLHSPAAKVGAVIGDVKPDAHGTSLATTGRLAHRNGRKASERELAKHSTTERQLLPDGGERRARLCDAVLGFADEFAREGGMRTHHLVEQRDRNVEHIDVTRRHRA